MLPLCSAAACIPQNVHTVSTAYTWDTLHMLTSTELFFQHLLPWIPGNQL